jgi:hypothetical protein
VWTGKSSGLSGFSFGTALSPALGCEVASPMLSA